MIFRSNLDAHHGDVLIFLAMSGGRFPDFNFARLS